MVRTEAVKAIGGPRRARDRELEQPSDLVRRPEV